MTSDRSAAVQHVFSRAAAASGAGDQQTAARYYEYAQRNAPSDGEITMAIGATRLALQDPRASEPFELIAKRDDVREAWLGLVAVRYQHGHNDIAAQDLRELLSRFGCSHDTNNLQMFDIVARTQGNVGWCGLTADGILHVTLFDPLANLDTVVVMFDGVPIASRPRRRSHDGDHQRGVHLLPDAWREASRIAVYLKTRHLLGSKLQPTEISRVEGFVGVESGGLTGWAWHPHDPECAPTLTIRDANGRSLRVAAREPAPDVAHPRPLAKPRRLFVAATDLHGFTSPIAVLDAGGRHLYGSPLDPQADRHSAAGAAELARRMFPASSRTPDREIELSLHSVPADFIGPAPIAKRVAQATGVDIVIPVYRVLRDAADEWL